MSHYFLPSFLFWGSFELEDGFFFSPCKSAGGRKEYAALTLWNHIDIQFAKPCFSSRYPRHIAPRRWESFHEIVVFSQDSTVEFWAYLHAISYHTQVCYLVRTLYGLRQAPQEWYLTPLSRIISILDIKVLGMITVFLVTRTALYWYFRKWPSFAWFSHCRNRLYGKTAAQQKISLRACRKLIQIHNMFKRPSKDILHWCFHQKQGKGLFPDL